MAKAVGAERIRADCAADCAEDAALPSCRRLDACRALGAGRLRALGEAVDGGVRLDDGAVIAVPERRAGEGPAIVVVGLPPAEGAAPQVWWSAPVAPNP